MEEYDALYPQYGFAAHKGYGTAAHIKAIREYGPCEIHRKTFIKKALGRGGEQRAAQYLTSLGWRILKTNYRTPFGEADIVAQDGDTVVFCEVKARLSGAYGSPGGGGRVAQAAPLYRHRPLFFDEGGAGAARALRRARGVLGQGQPHPPPPSTPYSPRKRY